MKKILDFATNDRSVSTYWLPLGGLGVLLGVFQLFILVGVLEAASSVKGKVTEAEPVFYAYQTPETATAVSLTMTWRQNHADLVLIQICNDTLPYSSVAAGKRVIRLDAGIPGDVICVLGVFTFGKKGDFTLGIAGAVSGPDLVKSREDLSLDPIYDERGDDSSFPKLREMAEKLRPKGEVKP